LTSWPWSFTALRCHPFKLCTKFDRNRVIHGWDIDDLARFRVQC